MKETKNARVIPFRITHFIFMLVLIAIDQITKYFVRTKIGEDREISLIKNVLSFVFVKNRGAVWGIGNANGGSVDILTIVTFIILAVIIFIYFRIPLDKKYRDIRLIAVFIISGAIGNLIDRISLKYVTDFIYIELIDFPVFNIADCYISLTCILTIILILTKYRNDDLEFLNFKSKKDKVQEEKQEEQK